MGIYSDAQGQLTPHSVVGSGLIWNSSELSCMSSLPASMEKDRIKTAEKNGNTVFSIITLAVAMETSSQIWPNFKFIQDLMYAIVTCKYEKDPIEKKWQHCFPHYKSMEIFSAAQGQLTPQSMVRSD